MNVATHLDDFSQIKTIFFDAGYTLFYIHPSGEDVFAEIGRSLGLSIDKKLARQLLIKYYNLAYHEVSKPREFVTDAELDRSFWLWIYERIFTDLGITEKLDYYTLKFFEVFSSKAPYALFDDVLETLETLQSRGYQMGIISNFSPFLTDVLAKLGIQDYFKHIVISTLVGYEKPHTAIFDEAVELSGYAPENCLHIGDNLLADVIGAHNAALKPVLLDRYRKSTFSQLEDRMIDTDAELMTAMPENYIQITTLTELLGFLQP